MLSSTSLLQPEIKGFQKSNQAIYRLDKKYKGYIFLLKFQQQE